MAALLAFALLGSAILAYAYNRARDPSFVFLSPEKGAEWIRYDRPLELTLLPLGTNGIAFRTSFSIDTVPERALISFRSLRLARLELDGEIIFVDRSPMDDWKRKRQLDLAPALSPGDHTLTFIVFNENGPSTIIAYSDALGIQSGEGWEASLDHESWIPAVSVDRVRPSAIGRAFPSSVEALRRLSPLLFFVFMIVAGWRYVVLSGHAARNWPAWASPDAGNVRWIVMLAWVALASNNIFKIPAGYGFDIVGHMEYIQFLIDNGRLPLATDGWKMNEPPFYYFVSALPYSLIYDKLSVEGNVLAMRVIPLLCGIAQVELTYRCMRYVCPERSDLQIAGTVVGSLIPLNLYLSQYASNQPFVALLSSTVLVLAFRYLRRTEAKPDHREAVVIGLVLGLALLTKLTAVLLIPPLVVLMVYASYSRSKKAQPAFARACAPALLSLSIAGVVSGWYYIRNTWAMGTPFSVGYSVDLGIVWRQDPGFRTMSNFTHFGESMFYPVYAVFASYWDSLYSTFWTDGFISSGIYPDLLPPWNFTFMLGGALLALVPMSIFAAGMVRTSIHPGQALREGPLFALLWIAVHLTGMIYLYLSVPVVSAGKAAYLLNLLPCFGILAASGLKLLNRSAIADPICCGALASWAVCAYAAFFVL